MGTGYTRQSAANIATGNTITAADLEAEYDAIESAFNSSTGHSHDGTTGEGPQIDLTAAVTGTLPVANGGTGGATASAARTALGLVIGTDVQAEDAGLTSIAGLTTAADKMIYTTASDTYAVTSLSSFGRTLIDDASASAARTTLGLVIGTNVQAYDAELAALAGLTSAANKVPYFTGSGTAGVLDFLDEDNMASDSATAVPSQQSVKAYVDSVSVSVSTLNDIGNVTITSNTNGEVLKWNGSAWVNNTLAEAGIAAASHTHVIADVTDFTDNSTNWDTAFGWGDHAVAGYLTNITSQPLQNLSDVTISTPANFEVLSYNGSGWINRTIAEVDAELGAIAGLTSAADKLPYFTGSGTASLADFSSFGRTLVDDANQAAAQTTLGLVPDTDIVAVDGSLVSFGDLSIVQGDLIYGSAADTVSRLSKGTASQVLAMNSGATAPEWVDSPGGTWAQTQSGTETSNHSITFTNTSGLLEFVMRVNGTISGVSTGDQLSYDLGDAGGLETSGYNGYMNVNISGTNTNYSYNNTNIMDYDSEGSSAISEALIHGRLIDPTNNTWEVTAWASDGTDYRWGFWTKSLSAEITQIQITKTSISPNTTYTVWEKA